MFDEEVKDRIEDIDGVILRLVLQIQNSSLGVYFYEISLLRHLCLKALVNYEAGINIGSLYFFFCAAFSGELNATYDLISLLFLLS